MDKIFKDNTYYLTKSITVLNGEIDRLRTEIEVLSIAVGALNTTITQKMERHEALERFGKK